MNTNGMLKGAIVWSLGLLVPAIYHALLMLAAVQEESYGYSFESIAGKFFQLPWIVWPYLIAMAIVGSLLIVSGFKENKT